MVTRVETDEKPLGTPSSDESGLGNSCDTPDASEPEAALVVPPDGGWGWVVVAASFFCNMIVDGIIFSVGLLSNSIKADFEGASESQVALVNSLLSGFYLLAGPFVSALANRYGFRIVTIIGSVIGSVAFGLSYYANSIIYLHVIYGVIGGIGFCMMYMPAVITVGFYFERWRALATGLALCGSGVGTFVLAPLTKTLVDNYGWRYTVMVHGGLVIFCAICGLMFRPIKPVTVTMDDENETEAAKRHEEAVEKLNSMFKLQQKLDSGLSLPQELRVNSASPHTWMGVSNNTKYPTAAEIFKGSNSTLNRRSSANAATIKNQLSRPPRYLAVPVVEKDEHENDSNASGENTSPLIGRRSSIKIQEAEHKHKRPSIEPVARPFYRDDIFFSGSLARLPQYKSHTSLGYHLAVTHVPTKQDVKEERDSKCKLCPEAMRRTLATMLDVSLFFSPTFILLALSGLFTMLGFFVPYAYVTKRADVNKMLIDYQMYLVSAIGAANIVGRILCGIFSSFDGVSSLWVNNVAVTIGGIFTMLSGLSCNVAFQYIYCVVFGLSVACFASLRSILVVEYLGLERLTNCFGLLLLFQGFGALLGSPIAGALYDMTGSYDTSFYLSGAFLVISAVLCYPIDYVSRWEKSRDKMARSDTV